MTPDTAALRATPLFYVDDVTGEPCPTRGNVLCTVPWSANGTHRHHDGRLDRHAPEEGS